MHSAAQPLAAAQHDIFLPMLSAWESLDIYIQLSLPVFLSKEDRHARMDAVLESMGLLRSKHTKARLPCPCTGRHGQHWV